jgi:nitrate reductase gamma subunit
MSTVWNALPYVVIVLFAGGVAWRYRYDKFGWTTRSSQVYESRLLSVASPVFHYGILFVLAGHLVGLFIPDAWTSGIGVSDHAYHLLSLCTGTIAGAAAVVGIALLIYRRRTTRSVFRATTGNDKVMYVVLLGAIVMGMWAKLSDATGDGYDYRRTVSPWVRSVFTLQPEGELMSDVPVLYQIHVIVGLALIAFVPYSRLVHMLAAPVQYLFRPYVVYRSRAPRQLAARAERRGWEGVR